MSLKNDLDHLACATLCALTLGAWGCSSTPTDDHSKVPLAEVCADQGGVLTCPVGKYHCGAKRKIEVAGDTSGCNGPTGTPCDYGVETKWIGCGAQFCASSQGATVTEQEIEDACVAACTAAHGGPAQAGEAWAWQITEGPSAVQSNGSGSEEDLMCEVGGAPAPAGGGGGPTWPVVPSPSTGCPSP